MAQGKAQLGDFLFPRDCSCMICNRESILDADGICRDCRPLLRFCPSPPAREPLDGLAAAFVYEEIMHAPIHTLKYHGGLYLGGFFARFMEIPAEWALDVIVPVPLHWLRQLSRGYNQSKILADAVAEWYPALPVEEGLLKRVRYTRSQTHLSEAARKRNMRNAFAARSDAQGRNVLLVDDVATTLSTLCACAAVLKRAGAERVYALCACAAIK